MRSKLTLVALAAFGALACSSSEPGDEANGAAGATSPGGTSAGSGAAMAGSAGTGVGGSGTSAGGTSAGGTSAGGTSAGGKCARAVGSCSAPTVKVTRINVDSAVVGYGQEGDTDPLPLALAAMPSGGSRLAWLGTDKKVHIAELDCNDQLVDTPFSLDAVDLQDLYAHDDGGAVLLTRDATGSGEHHCGSGQLCGGSSSPCRTMFLVRFDGSGKVLWETQVTNLGPNLDGYQNGARFVWWYQHHGRLAFDGANYAAYFGVAITVDNGGCVDIHEGDRMQVVGPTGMLLSGHDSFEVGCSHSWQARIVWDDRAQHFSMVCATDNDCRIAQPNPYRTVAKATCDGTFFGGDLINASVDGYWTAWSQGGTIRLQHFGADGPKKAIDDAGDSQHPHLVAYGNGRMLLSWGSGSGMTAQVRSAGAEGESIGQPFSIAVNDHDFQAFKSFSDGSVAYPGAGNSPTAIDIARVLPCQ